MDFEGIETKRKECADKVMESLASMASDTKIQDPIVRLKAADLFISMSRDTVMAYMIGELKADVGDMNRHNRRQLRDKLDFLKED